MNRNKDSDSYIKYISVIDLIIKNSDEKNPITINQIQDLIYDKGYDFKIDMHRMAEANRAFAHFRF